MVIEKYTVYYSEDGSIVFSYFSSFYEYKPITGFVVSANSEYRK